MSRIEYLEMLKEYFVAHGLCQQLDELIKQNIFLSHMFVTFRSMLIKSNHTFDFYKELCQNTNFLRFASNLTCYNNKLTFRPKTIPVQNLKSFVLIFAIFKLLNTVIQHRYSQSYFGQKAAKGTFGPRVKLPPVYHTRWRLHTVS